MHFEVSNFSFFWIATKLHDNENFLNYSSYIAMLVPLHCCLVRRYTPHSSHSSWTSLTCWSEFYFRSRSKLQSTNNRCGLNLSDYNPGLGMG